MGSCKCEKNNKGGKRLIGGPVFRVIPLVLLVRIGKAHNAEAEQNIHRLPPSVNIHQTGSPIHNTAGNHPEDVFALAT